MPTIDLFLELSKETCLAHYEGRVENVFAYSLDGRRVVFPASALRRIVTEDGVQGVFRLRYSSEGRFESIQRIE